MFDIWVSMEPRQMVQDVRNKKWACLPGDLYLSTTLMTKLGQAGYLRPSAEPTPTGRISTWSSALPSSLDNTWVGR